MTDSRFQRGALLLAAVATLHGLLYIPLVHRHSTTDTDTYVAAAHAVRDGNYTTPLRAGFYFTYPTGFYDLPGKYFGLHEHPVWSAPEKQAFRTPAYPVALAAMGGGAKGTPRLAATIVQAFLLGLATWLLALTVRRWWGPRLALASEALFALDPYTKHYVTLVVTETVATLVAVALAYAFTRAWQERTSGWWAGAGALAAALTLTRPVFVLVIPLLVVAAFVRFPVRNAAAAAVAAAILLTPWLIWTNHVTGKPVLSNWGEGFNLLLAAHGEGLGRGAAEIEREQAFIADTSAPRAQAPTTRELLRDPYAHPRYLRVADEELRSRARELYRERLTDRPLRTLWENVYRNYFLWSAHHDWYQPHGAALVLLRLVDWLLIAFALVGIVVAFVRRGPAAAVATYLVVYSVTLATHHVEARFAMPLRGFFLAYAVLGTATLVRKTQSQKGSIPVAPAENR
jgi:4-amino-4-deoxy-L-arabinose transferase-like glycosyltransferase